MGRVGTIMLVVALVGGCGSDSNEASDIRSKADIGTDIEDATAAQDIGTELRLEPREIAPDEAAAPDPAVLIGTPCTGPDECNGGTCMESLPGGYCTISGCGASLPCPDGSICSPIHQDDIKGTVCLKACDMPAECRLDDGYACDRDMTCWPVEGGLMLHPEGESCILDTQCAADFGAVCYPEYYADQPTGYTDGYCIIWNCDFSGCPPGTDCVSVNDDSSACFKECYNEDQCRPGYYCDNKNWVCVAGCSGQLDCPQKHVCLDSVCLEASYACSVANPAGWCPTAKWCDAGECKPIPFACGDDEAEPNDTLENAVPLETRRLFGLTICAGDEDWYRVTAPAGTLTEIKLVFSHKAGNLDMLAYREDGEFIRARWINYPYQGLLISDFDVSGESVSFFSPEEKDYYIKVVGADGAENTYGLIVRHYPYEDGPWCPDLFDQDDCEGMPAGVMKLYQLPQPDAHDPYSGGLYQIETVSSYLWARRELIMLVRSALRETMDMYPYDAPISIIDGCQEDGVTPGYNIGQPRHCRTCHDEGGNIDIAYFATDGNNSTKTVCGPNGTNVTADGLQCTQAASTGHIVDLTRQAYFMAKLFESPRARVIGVDPVLAPLIVERAGELLDEGIIAPEGLLGLQMYLGLWPTHHHHIHVSVHWWKHQFPEPP